ncbi:alpha-1,2-fucosyltransferase [Rhodoferax koreense]|uniref:Alpha-1,2-fucosyltransferase n=1 Tax=Rhodoferax koreensis TaxID=1842727 RepID=A0A1P8JTB5_9BURK|nr:alpha-1,2-fucosyltransferase [Rhodoferax koreense]APW36993.1 alpha-1,2-fucosyltransferase [Rhodoferax koreense]
MIVAKMTGGLGNQMFQYAAARALAWHKSQPLYLDLAGYETQTHHQGFELFRLFHCKALVAAESEIRKTFGWRMQTALRDISTHPRLGILRTPKIVNEPSVGFWPGFFEVPDDVYLSGYWQSEKYFSDVAGSIRSEFLFKTDLTDRNLEWSERIAKSNSVSLHVRRGDYVFNQRAQKLHGVMPLSYYEAAIAEISRLVQRPVFFVFSDDSHWCSQHIKAAAPCHFLGHNTGAESFNDMRLMSLCKHNIIANSSFSWWGAWLNANEGRQVIAPRRWYAGADDSPDLLPASWLRV